MLTTTTIAIIFIAIVLALVGVTSYYTIRFVNFIINLIVKLAFVAAG